MEHSVWVEKYRPKNVEDCILPFRIKQIFLNYVKEGEIPSNLFLLGSPGLGKTTVIRAVLDELEAEHIFLNAALEGNIDTVRYELQSFATKMSLSGTRKYIVFDECERMTVAAQTAIRAFIEEFSETCGFIFISNNKSTMDPAILSRLAIVDFSISKQERPMLLKEYYKAVIGILNAENIEYDKEAIKDYIAKRKNNIDFRNIIITLQYISKLGKITDENLYHKLDERFLDLIQYLKKKNFNGMRKWVIDNNDITPSELYRLFYDNVSEILRDNKAGIAALILLIGKYQYQNEFVADTEINTAAFLTECMVDVEW
jgi:DNA polymerase III delta prime subunit